MYFFDETNDYFRFPRGAVKTGETLRLRIKLLRGAVNGAKVYLRRDSGESEEFDMRFSEAQGAYDVYEHELKLEEAGLFWYNFVPDVVNGDTIMIPKDWGSSFQVTVYSASDTVPDWIKGGLIYHVFVDRFRRSENLSLRPGAVYREDWEACPYYLPDEKGIVHNNDFFGGDLYGVMEKLPYLKRLGVNCIYLSPVFEAASNHKYDTGDYMKVDSAFGGCGALEQLCREAANFDMKVILDGVFNHVGADSLYFNRYGNYESVGAYEKEQSPYRDWFTFSDDGTYEAWWGIELLPAVNEASESFREYICGEEKGVISHWMKKGVSGWRLDVVDELPDIFLDPLCEAIKREKNDAIIVGEVWEDASNKIAYDVRRRYFQGGQLDSVTNYPLKNAIIACVKDNDAEILASVMAELCKNYPEDVLHCLMNILGTHDTARILTVLGGAALPQTKAEMEHFRLNEEQLNLARRRLKLASTLQYTLPGVPCVYYGDEAGMQGGADPFNRRCYPWGKEDAELLDWYEKLSEIRQRYSCFKDGKYELVEARAGLFAFTRGQNDDRVLIAVNTTENDKNIEARGFDFDILENKHSDILTVKAYKAAVYKGER